jgi:hypothetical protein
MTVRTFLRIGAVLLLCMAAWGVNLLIHQWSEQRIGGYDVRQNAITGIVEIQTPVGWATSFAVDPMATAIVTDDLKRVRVLDVTWGRNGLLCARVLVAPGPAVRGRLALRIDLIDVAWKKHIRQRELRETVDWPGGSLTPFVLRTNLSAPAGANVKTYVTLLPTQYSGD